MDDKRFDHLTRSIAGASRRSILKAGLGALLGGAFAISGRESTNAATGRKAGQICRKDGDCTSNLCGPADSRGRRYCVCNTGSDCPTPANKCQEAICNQDGVCGVTLRKCDDNNACTIDTCDPKVGCKHIPISCNDNNPCTIDTCDPQRGCINTPITCDDRNACTRNSCDVQTGKCINTPIVCEHTCDPDIGCVECLVASDCTDYGKPCKTATCEQGVCKTVLSDEQTPCIASPNAGSCDAFGTCCMASIQEGACVCPEGEAMDNYGRCCVQQVLYNGVCT